jgi:hypothetical protein
LIEFVIVLVSERESAIRSFTIRRVSNVFHCQLDMELRDVHQECKHSVGPPVSLPRRFQRYWLMSKLIVRVYCVPVGVRVVEQLVVLEGYGRLSIVADDGLSCVT